MIIALPPTTLPSSNNPSYLTTNLSTQKSHLYHPNQKKQQFIHCSLSLPSKVIYWSLNINILKYLIKQTLARQCYIQLQRFLKKKKIYNLPYRNFCSQATLYSQKSILCRIYADQLNVWDPNMRKWKALDWKQSKEQRPLFKSENAIEDANRIKDQKQIDQSYNFIQAVHTKLRIDVIIKNSTMLQKSSINIKKLFLKAQAIFDSKGLMKLGVVKIGYFKSLQTRVGQGQISEIVKRELCLHLFEQSNIKESDIDKGVNEPSGQSKTLIWSNFVRPFTIFKALTNCERLNHLKNTQKDSNEPIVWQISSQSREISKDSIGNFLS